MITHEHRQGDGTDWVLLLHGAGADHRSLRGQVEAFAPSADILLPHIAAPGETADFPAIVDELVALLDAHGATAVTIVGHSFGSHLAQELAWRLPDRVSRLVLIGCYDQHRARDTSERMRVALTSAIVTLLPWSAFARFSARVATPEPELRDELLATHLAMGKRVFLQLGRSGSLAKHPVDRYAMPVLLIRGEREYSTALGAVYTDIAARSDRSREIVIAGAGHLCAQEDPAATNAAITAFVAGSV